MKTRIKVLYSCNPIKQYGICGKESDLIDIDGNKLCVGDVVEFSKVTKGKRFKTGEPFEITTKGKAYVVERHNKTFVMGLNTKELAEWNIRRIKSFTDTKQNEKYSSVMTKFKKRHVLLEVGE
ncbi:MAG: hypothetical protein ACI4ES_12205 [Roseburia sp.]